MDIIPRTEKADKAAKGKRGKRKKVTEPKQKDLNALSPLTWYNKHELSY